MKEGPGMDWVVGIGVLGGCCVVFVCVGIVVIGVDEFEGGGMRVTGVFIGARMTFGRGIGLRLPVGGGIRVTGVARKRCGAGEGRGA
jgi:hypothetical protein